MTFMEITPRLRKAATPLKEGNKKGVPINRDALTLWQKEKPILKRVIRGILVKAKRYRQQFALIYQRGNGWCQSKL